MEKQNVLDYYLAFANRNEAIFTLAAISSFSIAEIQRILNFYQNLNEKIQEAQDSSFYEYLKEKIVEYITMNLQNQYSINKYFFLCRDFY